MISMGGAVDVLKIAFTPARTMSLSSTCIAVMDAGMWAWPFAEIVFGRTMEDSRGGA
jgi:hypothetical protein